MMMGLIGACIICNGLLETWHCLLSKMQSVTMNTGMCMLMHAICHTDENY